MSKAIFCQPLPTVSPVRKLTLSGLIIALYVAIMFFTQGFAFGPYQIRLATSLYALSAIFPFLILPLGLSNMLSNTLMGGLGLLDMLGGGLVGILTAGTVYWLHRSQYNVWFIAAPIILFPGLIVPLWLSYLLHLPYAVLAASVTVGQIIPGILGVFYVKELKKFATPLMNHEEGDQL